MFKELLRHQLINVQVKTKCSIPLWLTILGGMSLAASLSFTFSLLRCSGQT